MDPKPKRYSFREVEFWNHRFDPTKSLTVLEIENEFGLDRSGYSSIQTKLKWNLGHGFAEDPKTQELLKLATDTTEVQGERTPGLIDILVATRAYQINWERQRKRYLAKRG